MEMLCVQYIFSAGNNKIKEIRGKGLMLAIEFEDEELARQVVEKSLRKGLILFYFLSLLALSIVQQTSYLIYITLIIARQT